MVKVFNKTLHQRIYTLEDGTTLRVDANKFSKPFEEKNVTEFIRADEKAGKVDVVSVSHAKDEDTDKSNKGGKK